MIFRQDDENNSLSTINGTLGWPTDEAENDQFAEPFSTVSQLVRVPIWPQEGDPLASG